MARKKPSKYIDTATASAVSSDKKEIGSFKITVNSPLWKRRPQANKLTKDTLHQMENFSLLKKQGIYLVSTGDGVISNTASSST